MKVFYVFFTTFFHWTIILDFNRVVNEIEFSIMRGTAAVARSVKSRARLTGSESMLYPIIAK